ncbi:DUF1189 family protein [Lysinibacillus sp. FSL H8-0500]|uniref:4-hydroxy-3-methylbut-2-en-1-yl diphosphate synthase n=1 Tax=Lysinibacillus macroides TaxID=33935 RepID=A0A0N0CUV7_9BACI|nr:DUF1189 family protein [Lysinibacillus macroides]KOY80875.1 4-hydroxy-3-methylbut-2-en-1-yl diphosphate synthase [Lysinibacillus macroides]QPR68978.1 DUF1189 family protein [Lysinibacillus macroides]
MKHSQLFIDSLIHPKKLAAYRLLPIGKVIQYTFLLITIVTVFSLGRFAAGMSVDTFDMSSFNGLTEYIEGIKWLLYPFTFLMLFVVTTLLIFAQIAIYALAGLFILKIMKRRGEYRHIWRTTTFAITWATLLSMLADYLPIHNAIISVISLFLTIILLIVAFTKYPKQPIAK